MTQVTDADQDAMKAFFRDERVGTATRFSLGAKPGPLLDTLARHRKQAVQEAVAPLQARIAELEAALAFMTAYPRGTRVRKVSGPQWSGVVVGHYSSSFTPEGLAIECTAEGARGQVHVEPAKRMEIDNDAG